MSTIRCKTCNEDMIQKSPARLLIAGILMIAGMTVDSVTAEPIPDDLLKVIADLDKQTDGKK